MSDGYTGHMLEQILDEIRAVHEVVADHPTRGEFERLEQKVDKLSGDMQVVRAATTDTSRQVNGLEQRIA
jgi:hypothetical protein